MSYGRDRIVIPVTIANGTSLSAAVNVNSLRIVGIMMPASWTAAGITFAALVADGTTYGKVRNAANTEVVVTTPAAGEYVALADTNALIALGSVKVRSGTAAVPVNQGAERILKLVCVAL